MADILKESIEQYGLSKDNRPKSMFSKIGLAGCGTVGRAIARIISRRGIEVVFVEKSEHLVKKAYDELGRELDQLIEQWKMTAGEKRGILSRIKGSVSYKDLKDCDLVIDAILSKNQKDNITARKEVFSEIEKHVGPETIIVTNSATLPITDLSEDIQHKGRCLTVHFSTTTPDSKILEVARGPNTSDEVYEKILLFAEMLDKKVITVTESPGLVSVRLFVVIINEACQVVMENLTSKEDVDTVLKRSIGTHYGPFEMADKIGLDKVVQWMESLYKEFGDVRYKPNPLIKRYMRANHLGMKTSRGFYEYDKDGKKIEEKVKGCK